MKIVRSSKCSLKFANPTKLTTFSHVLDEYGKVVNFFIEQFWPTPPRKSELLKPVVDSPTTWLSARLRKVAAREAIDMIRSAVERDGEEAKRPTHRGERMHVSSTIASLVPSKKASEFDAWLQLRCIGENIRLDIPIKFHDHYNELVIEGIGHPSSIGIVDRPEDRHAYACLIHTWRLAFHNDLRYLGYTDVRAGNTAVEAFATIHVIEEVAALGVLVSFCLVHG